VYCDTFAQERNETAAELERGEHLVIFPLLGGMPREQKMLKGHLPRVKYHHVH